MNVGAVLEVVWIGLQAAGEIGAVCFLVAVSVNAFKNLKKSLQ